MLDHLHLRTCQEVESARIQPTDCEWVHQEVVLWDTPQPPMIPYVRKQNPLGLISRDLVRSRLGRPDGGNSCAKQAVRNPYSALQLLYLHRMALVNPRSTECLHRLILFSSFWVDPSLLADFCLLRDSKDTSKSLPQRLFKLQRTNRINRTPIHLGNIYPKKNYQRRIPERRC